MLVAITSGAVAGYFMLFLVTGVLIGVPVVGTLKKNRRDYEYQAEVARTAHMDGWVPGSTLPVRAQRFEGADTGSETPGPRIVETASSPAGAWVRIVNGPVGERRDFSRFRPVGDPLAVLREEEIGDSVSSEDPERGLGIGRDAIAAAAPTAPAAPLVSSGFRPPARALAPAVAEGMVLGSPQLAGCRTEPDRAKVVELGNYLALHNQRKMKRNEVIDAVWAGEDPEKSAGTLRNLMWMLRQAWGEELVPAATHGLYGLSEKVTSDWQRFRALVADASAGDEVEVLTRALTLYRGMPFEGVADGSYGWADAEMFSSDMENAGRQASLRLSRLTLSAGELDHARWAAEKGLVVSPYDMELWKVLMEIAGKRGPGEVERVYERAKGVLGEDVSGLEEVVGAYRSGTT